MCTSQGGPRIAPPDPTSTLTLRAQQRCTIPSPMPPWVAAVPRLSSRATGRAIERFPTVLRCRNASKARCANLRVRSASTHVSPTAINLRPDIPPQKKELHNALSALSGVAENYANLSRLQLALEGVAAHDAVTRVAGTGHARQRDQLRG